MLQTPLPAVSASLQSPSAVTSDASGTVFFTSDHCVYKRDTTGLLTRVAGSSSFPGYSGDGGPAINARFNRPAGLALDSLGNLFIADTDNQRIRKVAATTGIVTTVAGNGISGHGGDGGPAIYGSFANPSGIALDDSGNLYIADDYNSRIRKVQAATGILSTVAGSGFNSFAGDGGAAVNASLNCPTGVALDSSANLYIADRCNNRIRKVAAATGIITTFAGSSSATSLGDGGPATEAQISTPRAVVVDASGNLLIADSAHHRIRKVSAATGIISTVAGNGGWGTSGDGGPAIGAQLQYPLAIALSGAGNLYIADSHRIRQVSATEGSIATVAGNGTAMYSGDGGPAANAQIGQSNDVALDGDGNLYIANTVNYLIRKVIAATGVISTIAGNGTEGFSGDGFPAVGAQFSRLSGLAADGPGNLYITDSGNQRIRKIAAATGMITTVAGTGVAGFSGDGGLAINAALNAPAGLAVDGSGNLYIADTHNHRIRRVSAATGIITTVAGSGVSGNSGDGGPATAAQINSPNSVAADGFGNLYITDGYSSRVRKVSAATGAIVTVAGIGAPGYSGDDGPATNVKLGQHLYVGVDKFGDLLVADSENTRIRKVSAAAGTIATVAGNGGWGFSGDGGPATSAKLNYPCGIAVDSSGGFYFADSGNSAVRFLTPGARRALLSVNKTHIGNFATGQTGASYSLFVSNSASAGAANGTVTVSEIVPAGLTLKSMYGVDWNCPPGGSTCTRSDLLSPGSSYPPITVLVNVAASAPSQITNQVSLVGGGSVWASASETTNVLSSDLPPTVPITLNTSPAGQNLIVDGTIMAPQTFNWTVGSEHSVSAPASQAGSGTRYFLANWSDGGAQSHMITVPATATTYTANFTTQYLLTANVNPGGVGFLNAFPTSGDGYYNSGTIVQLTATPANGFSFSYFTGSLSGSTNPQNVIMTAPRSVTANFSSGTSGNAPPYAVELSPFQGSGVAQTFTGTFNDDNGWMDIAKVTFFFHESYAGTSHTCTVEMRSQAGQITLLDDVGVNYLTPVALGSASQVQNSACIVDAAHSSFSGSGNLLTASVALTFKPAFGSAGSREPRKAICQWAKDTAGAGEPQSCFGLWIPEAPAPVKIPRYRLYNPVNYAHFFTASQNERDVLVARGLQPEDPPPGMAYNQPSTIGGFATHPFYRILFFPQNGAPIFHYWTRDREEYKAAVRNRTLNLGESIDSFLLSGQAPGSFPTYRLRFTAGPTAYPIYHYALQGETDALIAMGWGVSTGVDGYLQPMPAPLTQVTADIQTPARKVIAAVLSAASHESGSVAPGQLIRVYGSNSSKLAQAFIDDSAVKLTAVTERYIELAIPETVAGKESIALFVDDLGVRTDAVTLAVTSANPAVFVKDFLGRGMVETLASEAGTVTLQVTGVGELDLGQPKFPLTVRLNGYPTEIISISAIADQPGRLAVNVKLPAEVLSADTDLATVSLQAGEANAQPGLLVRVR